MAKAHVPEDAGFATTPAPAVQMIECAITAGVPFARVAADSVYGVGDLKQALRRAGKGYVLGVSSAHHFGSWTGKPAVAGIDSEIAHDLDPGVYLKDWRRVATRCDRCPNAFFSAVALAATVIFWL